MIEESLLDKIFKKWKLLLFIVVLFFVGIFLYNYSYISISVSNLKTGSSASIKVVDQKSGSSWVETINSSSPVSKLVRRSSYQITATQENNSGIVVARTSGFLQKTEASVELKTRYGLQFVGDSPGACMNYSNNILVSYDCSGTSINVHVPATSSQPTYNKPTDLGVGDIEGIVSTKGGLVLIAQPAGEEDSGSTPHSAYLLDGSLAIQSKNSLSSLKSSTQYSVQPFKEGFVVYSSDFTDIQYFSSISATAQKIKINGPADNTQKPFKLSTSGDGLLVEYSTKSEVQDNSTGKGIGKAKVTMVLFSGNQSREFRFNTQYDNIGVCGQNKLCLLDAYAHVLSVFDVSGDKPSLLYKLSSADSMATNGKQTIVTSGSDVTALDISSMSGYNIYSSTDYKPCGINFAQDGYILCIGSSKTSAIYLSSKNKYDGIDDKLFKLQSLPEINTASIYKNLVFVSPNLGDVVYVPSIDGFGYDPTVKRQTYNAITNSISDIKISNTYRVTINGLP